jgi:hypothetical protein
MDEAESLIRDLEERIQLTEEDELGWARNAAKTLKEIDDPRITAEERRQCQARLRFSRSERALLLRRTMRTGTIRRIAGTAQRRATDRSGKSCRTGSTENARQARPEPVSCAIISRRNGEGNALYQGRSVESQNKAFTALRARALCARVRR